MQAPVEGKNGARMARTSGHVAAPPEGVWAELWAVGYHSAWVVGTIKIRAVDPAWPAERANLHDAAGAWPLTLEDQPAIRTCETGRRLVMVAGGWVDLQRGRRHHRDRRPRRQLGGDDGGAGGRSRRLVAEPADRQVGNRRPEEMLDRFTKLIEGRQTSAQLT
jgi:hypothetical protein